MNKTSPHPHPKKYVVVLAHADGWGALSANKIVQHLHTDYPDLGVYPVVSKATKTKEGKILTKLDDLKLSRELKETNLLHYFDQIDALYEHTPSAEKTQKLLNGHLKPEGIAEEHLTEYYLKLGMQQAQQHSMELRTFKQLAKQCCTDGEVHYTSRGGPKGGDEVAAVVHALEAHHGKGPEVLLSVDTMAILPKEILENYQCFSTHPGPLDTVKVEGMQGTLRSLVNQVFYDRDGKRMPEDHVFGMGLAHVKGTLFMQHPELDKGPPIKTTLTPVVPGMCAYQVRDEVYHALTDEMLKLLPTFLDKKARRDLVDHASKAKETADAEPHERIGELDSQPFAGWQGEGVGFVNESAPWGVEMFQNKIIDPVYFKNQMRRFFPGDANEFEKTFTEIYGDNLEKLSKQSRARTEDPYMRLYAGDPDVTIRRYKPGTDEVTHEYRNR